MTTRSRLRNRRLAHIVNFEVGGHRFIASIGFFDDGRIAELFINSTMKAGSEADVNAADGAFAISLALQYGCPLDVIRQGVKRNEDGSPQGPLGAALDAVAEERP